MQEVVNALPGGYPESIQPPTSNQQSLSQAVYARRSEYTRPRDIKIKVCSYFFLSLAVYRLASSLARKLTTAEASLDVLSHVIDLFW
jgi:hypothetical protein